MNPMDIVEVLGSLRAALSGIAIAASIGAAIVRFGLRRAVLLLAVWRLPNSEREYVQEWIAGWEDDLAEEVAGTSRWARELRLLRSYRTLVLFVGSLREDAGAAVRRDEQTSLNMTGPEPIVIRPEPVRVDVTVGATSVKLFGNQASATAKLTARRVRPTQSAFRRYLKRKSRQ